eukprot:1416945-Prymnesium_polylepis.1
MHTDTTSPPSAPPPPPPAAPPSAASCAVHRSWRTSQMRAYCKPHPAGAVRTCAVGAFQVSSSGACGACGAPADQATTAKGKA